MLLSEKLDHIRKFEHYRKSKLSFKFKPLIRGDKEIENGENRLAVSDYPLKDACLNGFSAPDISERLLSDYSVRPAIKDIETT